MRHFVPLSHSLLEVSRGWGLVLPHHVTHRDPPLDEPAMPMHHVGLAFLVVSNQVCTELRVTQISDPV